MTEQEAEAFAARLTRIWLSDERNVEFGDREFFSFSASFYASELEQQISLYVADMEGKMFYRLSRYGASLFYQEGGEISDGTAAGKTFQDSFSAQWLPFFRRGCWLSGCPIEVTAYEKAEWVQGFTREELEAWNLNM